MLTAIILCRANSSRFKNKHFFQIGKKTLIQIILDKLKAINIVNDIYIATGNKKNNSIFLTLKKKNKKIKFFFHKNENDVAKRIYLLSKKIVDKYTLIISGDCPIIDKKFIYNLFKNLNINNSYESIKYNKKVYYEGVNLVKTSSLKKIYDLSKKKLELKEHFSKVFDYFPKNFKIKKIQAPNKIVKKKKINLRLSIDTVSDLNFFNAINSKINNYNKLNLTNLLKNKNLSVINSHVTQKSVGKNYDKKILILTAANEDIGFGHLKRSLVLKRQISETISSNINLCYVNTNDVNFLYKKKYNFKKINFKDNGILIIDLPEKKLKFLKKFLKKNNFKKIIVIDNFIKIKNKTVNIIPYPFKSIKRSSKLKIGKKYLILDHNLLYENFKKKMSKKKGLVILNGGSGYVSKTIINYLNKYKYFSRIIYGPLTKLKKIKINLNKLKCNYKFYYNPDQYFEIIKKSKYVICRLGVSVYECIALGLKPYVIIEDETVNRLKEIFLLKKKGYINIFNKNTNLRYEYKKDNFKQLPIGAKFINKFIV